MRPLPLRWRVSILVAVALSTVIAVMCASAYVEAKELMLSEVDRNLSAAAKALVAVLEDGGTPASQTAEMRAIVGVSQKHRSSFYRVWVSGASEDLHAGGLGDRAAAVRKLLAGRPEPELGKSVFLGFGSETDPYQTIWTRTAASQGSLNVVVGQSVRSVRTELHEFLRLLLIVGSGVVATSIVLASLLVLWGLRPIRTTASRILNVTAENVGSVDLNNPKAPAELQPFVQSVSEMLGRLHDALERQKSFVSDASHELRTPIALAKSTVQLALARDRSEEQYKTALAETLGDLRRLEHLTEELLLLARMEELKGLPEPSEVDLASLLQELSDSFAGRASRGGGGLVVDAEPVTVCGNPSQLGRLFSNLIDNAMEHGPKGGTIRLAARQLPGWASVTVHDEGGGIPVEALPHLFDRFYRADPSRSHSTGGAGLGLAIVREIVTRHGGEVTITSEPPLGTTVTVRLPSVVLHN